MDKKTTEESAILHGSFSHYLPEGQFAISYGPITKRILTSIHWPNPQKHPNQINILKKASQAATRKSQEKNRR